MTLAERACSTLAAHAGLASISGRRGHGARAAACRGRGAERGRRAVLGPVRETRAPRPTPARDPGAAPPRRQPAQATPRPGRRAGGEQRPRAGGAAAAHGVGRGRARRAGAGADVGGRARCGRVSGETRSETSSPEETERAGAALAATLAPGDVVLVSGELGAGQDDVRARRRAGLGVTEPVTSPTFVVGHLYERGRRAPRPLPARRARRRGPGAAGPVLRARR